MSHKNSVLVIEPKPEMRLRISNLLEELDCEIQAASSKGLGEAVLSGCDLVLWDWEDWAGWVASGKPATTERRLPLYPRVVLLAHSPDECLWIQALRAGAFDYIEEPNSGLAMDEFRRVVASALWRTPEVPLTACA